MHMMTFLTYRFRNMTALSGNLRPLLRRLRASERARAWRQSELFRVFCWSLFYLAASLLLFHAHDAYAYEYGGGDDDNPSFKAYFFKLLRSPFGTLVMVFCGLGGFATLYMTREGPAGKQVPIAGIFLLIAAIGLFITRTMITSGLLGQEYLDYGR